MERVRTQGTDLRGLGFVDVESGQKTEDEFAEVYARWLQKPFG